MPCPVCQTTKCRRVNSIWEYTCGYRPHGNLNGKHLYDAQPCRGTETASRVDAILAEPPQPVLTACKCDLFMFAGCTCGAFKREQEAKQQKE
jgi:hypothetical protein